MLDQKCFINDLKELAEKLSLKGVEPSQVYEISDLIKKKNKLIQEVESLQAKKNQLASEISSQLAQKNTDDVSKLKNESSLLKKQASQLEADLQKTQEEIKNKLLIIPNIPHPKAPKGKSAKDNVEILRHINKEQEKQTEPHYIIGDRLGLLDQERASRLSGSLFMVLKGQGARLLRSLIQFAYEIYQDKYTDFVVPSFVNSKTFTATGHLPRFASEAYHIEKDKLWAIPTGEVPLTALHQNEILDASMLPLNYMTYTPCFRREAGSAGKETRGLGRLHEFHKVELVKICSPDESEKELESLLQDALKPIKLLKLPYRILDLCTSDLTFASARTYDIEVYSPGLNEWLEVSSVGLFTDYQMRRAKIRFRSGKKLSFPHALNGSGLATPRVLAALIEHNYQNGKLFIPEPLQKFMGCNFIEEK